MSTFDPSLDIRLDLPAPASDRVGARSTVVEVASGPD